MLIQGNHCVTRHCLSFRTEHKPKNEISKSDSKERQKKSHKNISQAATVRTRAMNIFIYFLSFSRTWNDWKIFVPKMPEANGFMIAKPRNNRTRIFPVQRTRLLQICRDWNCVTYNKSFVHVKIIFRISYNILNQMNFTWIKQHQ